MFRYLWKAKLIRVWPVVARRMMVLALAFPLMATGPLGSRSGNLDPVHPTNPPREVKDFAFENSNGQAVRLSDLKGRVALINLWAMWCEPCKVELPDLAKLQRTYASQGLEVVALSTDLTSAADIQRYFDQQLITLPFYIDRNQLSFSTFGIRGIPTTIVLNREGDEIARITGLTDWQSERVQQYVRYVLGRGQ